MVERAREKAKRILEEHEPLPLSADAQKKIDAIVDTAQNR
jgi:trimethylamine:corrinoid methyltransferase-like protein